MRPVSTESNIGRILLFVNGILASLAILVILMMSAVMGSVGGVAPMMLSGIMLLMMALTVAGAVVSFVAWSKAETDARTAGILGIVATFLPPTNIVALAAGILLLVSPEAKAQRSVPDQASRAPAVPPRH